MGDSNQLRPFAPAAALRAGLDATSSQAVLASSGPSLHARRAGALAR